MGSLVNPRRILWLVAVVIASFFLVTFASDKAISKKVIITTDTGADMDDEWTIAQAALAPELNLLGIVTTHAPSLKAPPAQTAKENADQLLKKLPLPRLVPVLAGSSNPLTAKDKPLNNPGVVFLIEQSKKFTATNRLPVLALGAVTDIASALLIDPSFAQRVEIVAMAFEGWPKGDDSWNVKNDVKAWQVLLDSPVPIVVGDATVTKRDLSLNRTQVANLFASRGELGKFLASLHTQWLDKHPQLVKRVSGDADTWPIWDQVTVAYLLRLTTSESRPRPALRDDLTFERRTTEQSRTIQWVTSVDASKLWRHFVGLVDGR